MNSIHSRHTSVTHSPSVMDLSEGQSLELVDAVRDALAAHPAVEEVRLVGSRAEGREHELSDWDLYVRARDFASLADDLPALIEPLGPLAQQWDPYAHHAAYMLMFTGPTKVDLC